MKSARNRAAFRCGTVILTAILVIASISLSGCSFQSLIPTEDKQSEDPSYEPNNTDIKASDGEKNEPDKVVYYNPLTGLISEIDLSGIRPVAVCIGNTADGMPQYGLEYADILLEAPIEGGSTRLTLISCNYADAPQIGPLRATRPYLLSVADAFGAVSVYSGTSDFLPTTAYPRYDTLDGASEGLSTVFFRNASLRAPNNLFTSGTRLVGAMENFAKKSAQLPFAFAEEGSPVTPGSGLASGVVIPFSSAQTTKFTYDAASKTYLRMQNNQPHTAGDGGAQLAFTNLLLLTCESSTHYKVTGTEMELNVTGGGRGQYISGGSYQEILWSRTADGRLQITDLSGKVLEVNRGKTYIGLVDLVTSGSVMIVQ